MKPSLSTNWSKKSITIDQNCYQIEVISSEARFHELSAEWGALLAASSAHPLFSSWHFCYTWWSQYNQYGSKKQLSIITLWDQKALSYILPIYKIIPSSRLSPKILRMIGSGERPSPDYLGPIADPKLKSPLTILRAIISKLPDWDIAILRDLCISEPLEKSEITTKTHIGFIQQEHSINTILISNLPSSWDQYLESLSANRRQQIRRHSRKLFEKSGATLEQLKNPDELDNWFSDLAALHTKRWEGRTENHAFSDDAYNHFFRQVMLKLLHEGDLRLWRIQMNDEAIAMLFCFRSRDTIYYYQGGFDPEFSKLKPGFIILASALKAAIEEGADTFNMLKGEYSFKESLAKETDQTISLYFYNPTPAGLIYWFRNALITPTKSIIRTIFSLRPLSQAKASAKK